MMLPLCITGHAVDRLRERFPLGTDEDWNQSKERLRGLYAHSVPFGCQKGNGEIRASGDVFLAIVIDAGQVVIKTVLTKEHALKSAMIAAESVRPPMTRRQKARRRHASDERAGDREGDGEVRVPLRRRQRRDAA